MPHSIVGTFWFEAPITRFPTSATLGETTHTGDASSLALLGDIEGAEISAIARKNTAARFT
jgi:hypothetical protein